MKLFTKYSRINLLSTIIIFLFAGLVFYFVIRFILLNQVEDDLRIEQREIQNYLQDYGQLPEAIEVRDQSTTYTLTGEFSAERKFSTQKMQESKEEGPELFRILNFYVRVNNKNYLVTVAKSMEGMNRLNFSIVWISSVTILMILVASLIINRLVLQKLWRPFYQSLDILKKFRVEGNTSLVLPDSTIDEFSTMNNTLEQVTGQANKDYTALKEFTENASHEMQTPLAIIRSKLDLLIQDESLSENQSKAAGIAYDSIEKLSRLNQSLLLLAKIGNNQFADTQLLDLRKIIEEKLSSFEELWLAKEIHISTAIDKVPVNMNKELADILLNNLLSNATKYNHPGGNIAVVLNEKKLRVTNSSTKKELDPARLFSRFYWDNDSKVENGLGLSIIKQICDASGFKVEYLYKDQQHSFTINW